MPTHDSDHTRPIDRLVRPFEIFAQYKLAGSLLLVAAAVIALVWANSPWAETYHQLLETTLTVGTPDIGISKSIHHWINDGLMGIFFFVIGLEIKREVLVGELSEPRKALLPVVAAIGGMVCPTLLYLAFNLGTTGAAGWGIPMATDIAFCLGVLLLLGDRVSPNVNVFLTALAIVDDIGAILVIAIFYTASLSMVALVVGTAVVGLSALANAAGMRSSIAYFILGTIAWFAFVKSGVHATLAAVLMAFTIPARTRIDRDVFLDDVDSLSEAFRASLTGDQPALLSSEQQCLVDALDDRVDQATSPLQRLEHALMPTVTFVALPVFALANAGVALDGTIAQTLVHPVALGIIAGLVAGKLIGVFGFTWIAVTAGLVELPSNTTWRHIAGIAFLAGIGFTMSLFINDLAFQDPALRSVGKTGILAASLVSGVAGYTLLRSIPPVDENESESADATG